MAGGPGGAVLGLSFLGTPRRPGLGSLCWWVRTGGLYLKKEERMKEKKKGW